MAPYFESRYQHAGIDFSRLSTFTRKKPEEVVEEPVLDVFPETIPPELTEPETPIHEEIQIDYDTKELQLVRNGRIIMSTPIDDQLIRKSDEEILMTLGGRNNIAEYVRTHQPIAYHCKCYYVIDKHRGSKRCTICGSMNNEPIYEGEEKNE